MSIELVKQINKTVDKNDILYNLGDWSFGGINNIWNFRKQINCKNIHLILGNHDHHIEHNKRINIPDETADRFHELDLKLSDGEPTTIDLFSSVQHVKTVKHSGYNFFLSHFAHRVWDKSHHGVIHLYGHSHNSIDNTWGKSMDCGVDTAYELLGAYRPFSLEEIVNIMDKREIKILDHHNSETTR
jgi:calcineurin-like phosphoesterase family protein